MTTNILITTFNRAHLLRNSLERMTHLTLADSYIVVDDGSSDNTMSVVNEFSGRLPIKYIYNHSPEHTICSMARNIGVKNTDADLIITTEPECLWVTDVVKQILEDHQAHPDQVISAGTIYHAQEHCPFHPGLITDPLEALKSSIVQDYEIQPRSYHPQGYCKTVNMQATFIAMYKRDWLMEVGGWDEGFEGAWGWDDVDLCTRLRIHGINQFIDKDIEAVHQWHSHLPPHLMGEASIKNEKRMQEKALNEVEKEIFEAKRQGEYTKIDERLVANKGKEWGVIK